MKARLWLIAVIVLLVAAVVFAVAMTGHTFVAALCAFIALVIVYFHFVRRRGLRIAAAIVLAAGIAVFGVIEAPIVAGARTDAPDDVEYLVVLGAGLHGDVPSLSLTDRLEGALAWLEAHPDCVAVVSGGQGPGETMTEGEAMGIWLEASTRPASSSRTRPPARRRTWNTPLPSFAGAAASRTATAP